MDLNARTRSRVRPAIRVRDGKEGSTERERGRNRRQLPVSSADSIAPDFPLGARDATTDMRTGIAMQPRAETSAPAVKTRPLGASPMITAEVQLELRRRERSSYLPRPGRERDPAE
eukprot:767254-Hanusia_phi.AAC.2